VTDCDAQDICGAQNQRFKTEDIHVLTVNLADDRVITDVFVLSSHILLKIQFKSTSSFTSFTQRSLEWTQCGYSPVFQVVPTNLVQC
jgi:hypothetical protein